jgi:hypothetical protein
LRPFSFKRPEPGLKDFRIVRIKSRKALGFVRIQMMAINVGVWFYPAIAGRMDFSFLEIKNRPKYNLSNFTDSLIRLNKEH